MSRIDDTATEIASMRTHSSSTVAVRAAEALRDLLDREYATLEEYERALERNSEALRRANPSHASLQTTQRAICEAVVDAAESIQAAKGATADAIDDVVDRIEAAKEAAAANAADRLPDGATFLTHDYSTTVVGTVERAIADGASLDAYVTEARPRYIGRKTAREFADTDGIDPTLIVDAAAGHVLADCDRVVLGMTCIVEDRYYNRVGTFPIAAAAAQLDVPVTVVGSSAKVVDGGFAFENDFRDEQEVMPEPAEFAVQNPAYDATPLDLVDEVVTDEGVEQL
jgi:translation initiation factor eIF-2B subunit delta